MGLKNYTINFNELRSKESLRLWIPYVLPKSKYKYGKINNFLSTCESGSRPTGGIKQEIYCKAISLGGEQIGKDGSLELTKIPYIPLEYYNNASKGKVKDKDILICKDGALTGKTCLVDFSLLPSKDVMVNEHIYVLRGNVKINHSFLFYLTRTKIFQSQIRDLAYKKKAQPGLNAEHFKKIKIPIISKSKQDIIVNQIKPIEKNIKELTAQGKAPQEIINKVFTKEFDLDIKTFEEMKKIRHYYLDLLAYGNNRDIRQSVKYHREAGAFVVEQLKKITSEKIKDYISEPIVLGKGISPKDYDVNGDYYYISMANIKNWQFEREDSKLISKEFSGQSLPKSVSKNDILIARSGEGTIGKVALIEDGELQGIFSDFTMRVRLQNCNPLFAYYYFRTEYFQYLIEINKKGLGNNTNIFPSQIQEFPMINICSKYQQKIVNEIKTELEKHEEMKKTIERERNMIDEIIEEAVK